MIGTTVLLPSCFGVGGTGVPTGGGIPLLLLQDLAAASAVLVDKSTRLGRVVEEIQSWPPEARKQATVLLESLQSRGRIVAVDPAAATDAVRCDDCRAPFRIVLEQGPDVLVYGDDCATHIGPSPARTEFVPIDQYPLSDFRRWVGNTTSVRIAANTVTKDQFELDYLSPLFRYAKRVTLYDRWIGNTLLGGGSNPHIKAYFAETISWMLSAYGANGRQRIKRFQITTGLDLSVVSRTQVPRLSDALTRFQQRMELEHKIPVEIVLKAERDRAAPGSHGHDLPHARFLVTNQIAIQIERGFALLEPARRSPTGQPLPQMVQDVTLSRLTETGRDVIETEVGRLETLAQIGRQDE